VAPRKIGIIDHTYRHVQRYREILTVLFKYGFGDLVNSLRIRLQMVSRKRREGIETLSRAERVRMAIEELGPTFVKMGQILSTRPDLLPAEFIRELEKLQDEVPPFDFSDVQKTVESELGLPLHEVFPHFDDQPLAAASIGQVHRGRLVGGEEVVVKVQRPGIRKTVEVDLEIMLHLADLMESHLEGWDVHRPSNVVREFARTLEKEMDYTIEASHIERFARQFGDEPTVHVPEVYRQMTTARVLTMEYVSGVKASEMSRLETEGLDPREIARRGGDLIMKQVFVHGFFHADPHPGNILILPYNVICYLDFGMMGRLDRRTREDFADLVAAVVRRDGAEAAGVLLKLTYWDREPDLRLLQRDVEEFVDQHFYRSLKELDLGKLLQQLLNVVSRHRLRIPPDLFLMLKALTMAEGLGRKLDAEFDMTKQAALFLRRIRIERLRPQRLVGDAVHSGKELLGFLKEMPGELREILKQAKHGKLKIEFEHRGLEPVLATHDRTSNRVAFAIVLASLVVGSALIVLSGVPPRWSEIPVIGLAGFLAAGAMGFWLLISILRHGRL